MGSYRLASRVVLYTTIENAKSMNDCADEGGVG